MPLSHNPMDIEFDRPATYRITVKGRIDKFYSENLGGMHISTQSHGDAPTVTILIGQLMDQAELTGVLNSLYELHMSILSVESLSGKEPAESELYDSSATLKANPKTEN